MEFASLAVGLSSKIQPSGMTRVSRMVLALQLVAHSKNRKKLDAWMAIRMFGKAFVVVATKGLRWLAARRRGLHGFDTHIR